MNAIPIACSAYLKGMFSMRIFCPIKRAVCTIDCEILHLVYDFKHIICVASAICSQNPITPYPLQAAVLSFLETILKSYQSSPNYLQLPLASIYINIF